MDDDPTGGISRVEETYTAGTDTTSVFDSFNFSIVGKKPSLFSRISFGDPRAFTEEVGEDLLSSMDISDADPSEPLGEGACLLRRLGLKEDDALLNHFPEETQTQADNRDLENESEPVDASEPGNFSALVVQTSQPILGVCAQPTVVSQSSITSPISDKDSTRSPTLVPDSKGDQTEAQDNININKLMEAHVVTKRVEIVPGQMTMSGISHGNTRHAVATLSTHQDAGDTILPSPSGLAFADQAPKVTASAATPLLSKSSSMVSLRTKDTLTNGTPPPRHHATGSVAPFLPFHPQPTPDPFKHMFASVFDEATAAWEEEVIHREKLKSLPSPETEHSVDAPIVQFRDQITTGSSAYASPPPSSRKPPVDPHLKLDVGKTSSGEQVEKVENPSGQAPGLPALPIAKVTPSPLASKIPRSNSPTAKIPIMSSFKHQRITHQDKDCEEPEDLKGASVVADEESQALTQSRRSIELKFATTRTSLIGNMTTIDNIPTKTCLLTDEQLTKPTVTNRTPSRLSSISTPMSGGVMLTDQHALSTTAVTTPSPVLAALPIPLTDGGTQLLLARPTTSSTPPSVSVDNKVSQELPLDAPRLVRTEFHTTANNTPPIPCSDLKHSKKVVHESQSLKRKLSASPVIKKEEDTDHDTMLALRYSHPLRPSKMKKMEDEDEKPLMKVEPKDEEKPLSENDHIRSPLELPLATATATETSEKRPNESECDQQTYRAVSPSMSFRYPSEPPITATAQSTTANSANSNYPERPTSHSGVGDNVRSSSTYRERNDRTLVERITEDNQNYVRPTSAISNYSGRSSRHSNEDAGSEAFPSYRTRNRPVSNKDTNRSRYLRDYRRSSPQRARSPSTRVDYYSSVDYPRPFDSATFRRDERRRSSSPTRPSSPIRNYGRHNYAQPSQHKAGWPLDNQETPPISFGRHSISASVDEAHLGGHSHGRDNTYSTYGTRTNYSNPASGSGSLDPGQSKESSGVALIDRFEFSRNNQNPTSLPTSTPQTQSVMHEQRTRDNRPMQETPSLLTRVEGLTSRSYDDRPRQEVKRKSSLSDALPPKPYLYPLLTGPVPSDTGSVSSQITASRLSDRLGPPAPLSNARMNDGYETRDAREDELLQQPRPPRADTHPRVAPPRYPKNEGAPSLLMRMGDDIVRAGSPESHVYPKVDFHTKEYTQPEPILKARSSPKSTKTNAKKTWRTVSHPDPQQPVSDLSERLGNSPFPTKPDAYEFSGKKQHFKASGGVQKTKSLPRRGFSNKNYPSNPRPHSNSFHPYRGDPVTAMASPHRRRPSPSPSPGDKLASRIK